MALDATKELQDELKRMIIDVLDLEDIGPNDIITDDLLFGDGLGLDSIDALELGVEIQKRYGIVLEGEESDLQSHFMSVATLAAFIEERRVK